MNIDNILLEASYPGNIGAMEVFKFHRIATSEEKSHFDNLLKSEEYDKAWDLIQDVTGDKLHPFND